MYFVRKINCKVHRVLKKKFRLQKARKKGLKYVPPNFIYFPQQLSKNSIVIDGGCSYEADFSLHMIKNYGLKAYGVDPTRKHKNSLNLLVKKHKGRFTYLPFAINAIDGTLMFHESKTNESGSLLKDHTNVKQDKIINYKIKAISLKSLLKYINIKQIEILKLDLEGAEYDLLNKISKEEVLPFRQIFVEFHHHAIDHYNKSDTLRIVKRICNLGFNNFSLDDHNYLFYKIN